VELSVEFWTQIGIQLIALAFVAGGIIQQVKYLSKQITKLEKKQEKHNKLIERMVVVEHSTKSAHRRIDKIAERGKDG
jgi:cell division protein FtsL